MGGSLTRRACALVFAATTGVQDYELWRSDGTAAGTVLVESVFAIPGIGRFMVDAVVSRDFPVIQGGVLVIAATYATVNALTDLIGLAADPRTRA